MASRNPIANTRPSGGRAAHEAPGRITRVDENEGFVASTSGKMVAYEPGLGELRFMGDQLSVTMETEGRRSLDEWMSRWADLWEFTARAVVTPEEAAARMPAGL